MFALLAVLITPFGVGPINGHVTVSNHFGSRISVSLPPRTSLTDESAAHLMSVDRVEVVNGSRQAMRWTEDHSVQRFGSVATFNGITVSNVSRRVWINVYGRISR